MSYRLVLAILLLAAAAPAEETVKNCYKHAKRLQGDKKVEYAAQKAAEFEGKVSGGDLMYLGFLWRYAEQPEKADDAFRAFLESGEGSANRPLVMVERVRALTDMRKWDKIGPVADQFFNQYGSHRYNPQMRFQYGRALRVLGKVEEALRQFQESAKSGYVHAPPEVVDCLLQLGRYDDAVAAAKEKPDDSYFAVVIAAAGSFGKPLPKVPYDFWTLKELAAAEIKEKPAVFAFWSMKARRANDLLHAATNGWVERFGSSINAVGPTTYEKFDPSTMRSVDDMTEKTEQGFVEQWSSQYGVKYPLVLVRDNTLHKFCGIDAERPALPAFAVTDKKGVLRYVRVGGADWAFEAVATKLEALTKE